MNSLVELYQSTVALHERFNTSQTVQQSLERFSEEYNEVLNEIPSGNKDKISEEFADVLVTVIGVIRSIEKSNSKVEIYQALFLMLKGLGELYFAIRKSGVESKDLEPFVLKVAAKNNAKTLETHYLDSLTGKIKRKG